MSEIITVGLTGLLIWALLVNTRLAFKIAYYETKLENRGIEDAVKDLPWWKLYTN